MPNKLYFGDNLDVLRDRVAEQSVDLVYLDPPFNSDARYNVLFKSPDGKSAKAQAEAFRDTWTWDQQASWAFEEVARIGGSTAGIINALYGALGQSDLMAYLVMMAVRLHELHRTLKPTGSLYLHCDPTASHYLKMILDGIFGPRLFRNEISWRRSSAHSDSKQGMRRYGRVRDVILFYTKSSDWTWNTQYTPYQNDYLASEYRHEDEQGRLYKETDPTAAKDGGDVSYVWRVKRRIPGSRRWEPDFDDEYIRPRRGWEYREVLPYNGRFWAYSKANLRGLWDSGNLVHRSTGMPRIRHYADEMPGIPLQDDWGDISMALGEERLGYPTQKPIGLLDRIIRASSNPEEVVLDPFCGCGTTIHVAERLGRQWIGIDVAYHAIQVIRGRLHRHFKDRCRYDLGGVPSDVESAQLLAEKDRYQFQWWANYLVGVERFREVKKGRDRGIDGEIFFPAGPGRGLGRILTSVKSGQTKVADLRDFMGVLSRENADAGVFICMGPPTRDMRANAASAGFFRIGDASYPRLQIFSIQEYFEGAARLDLPTTGHLARRFEPRIDTGKRRRAKKIDPRQIEMILSLPGGKKAKEGVHINPALLLDEDEVQAEAAKG